MQFQIQWYTWPEEKKLYLFFLSNTHVLTLRNKNLEKSEYYTKIKVKLATLVKGDLKDPFSIATTPRCRGGCYSISCIALLYPYNTEL